MSLLKGMRATLKEKKFKQVCACALTRVVPQFFGRGLRGVVFSGGETTTGRCWGRFVLPQLKEKSTQDALRLRTLLGAIVRVLPGVPSAGCVCPVSSGAVEV